MTLFVLYYDSPDMLKKQLEYWAEYTPGMMRRLRIIVIDDGSPLFPAEDVLRSSSLQVDLYRIDENIPWNYVGARNLGFYLAEDGWVFQTDMDHVVPVESMRSLLMYEPQLLDERFYRPNRFRINNPSQEYKRHNSTFILHRRRFWEIGGYNEDFAGFYGGASSAFRRELKRRLNCEELMSIYTYHYQDVIPDASVSDWGRKNSPYYYKNDPVMRKKANKIMKNYEALDPLRFTWRKVECNEKET